MDHQPQGFWMTEIPHHISQFPAHNFTPFGSNSEQEFLQQRHQIVIARTIWEVMNFPAEGATPKVLNFVDIDDTPISDFPENWVLEMEKAIFMEDFTLKPESLENFDPTAVENFVNEEKSSEETQMKFSETNSPSPSFSYTPPLFL